MMSTMSLSRVAAVEPVTPGSGLLAAVGQVWGVLWAELTMQWRRWGLWVTFACVTTLLVLLTVQAAVYFKHLPSDSLYVREHFTPAQIINIMTYGSTAYGAMFFGLVAALLVVDRMGRDRRLGMFELQRATPQGYGRYVLGKFLGNYLATLIPTFLAYLLCALVTVALGWPPILIVKFLQAFLLVNIPSSFAAVGLTLLLASFLPLRVVQVGFSILWFEFNIGLGWHALAFTLFNPSGTYIYPVFFPVPPLLSVDPTFRTSLPLALLNIGVLLLTAIAALFLTYGSLIFQQSRKEAA